MTGPILRSCLGPDSSEDARSAVIKWKQRPDRGPGLKPISQRRILAGWFPPRAHPHLAEESGEVLMGRTGSWMGPIRTGLTVSTS